MEKDISVPKCKVWEQIPGGGRASELVSAAVCDPLPQVTELKTKLVAAERVRGTLERERLQRERPQGQRVDARPADLTRDPRLEVGGGLVKSI